MENRPMTATAATPPVIMLPAEIDATNSGLVEAELTAACVPGAGVIVVDLSGTDFCDSSALRALVMVDQHAASLGIEFRLVVSTPPVLRVLELTGLRNILRLYPSVEAAISDG
jgi:anti-sigma B factor antagonist